MNSQMPSVSKAIKSRAMAAEAEREARKAGLYEAEEIYNHLIAEVDEFQQRLPEDHEVAIRLANYGEAASLNIRGVSFKNPNLIEFYGVLGDHSEVILIQHISELNFMLIASKPVEDKPFRIGFNLGGREDDENEESTKEELVAQKGKS